jgi:hypothetical protein
MLGIVDKINFAQYRHQQWDIVSTVMNINIGGWLSSRELVTDP